MQHNNNGFRKEEVLGHELTEADLSGIYGGNGNKNGSMKLPSKGADSSQDGNDTSSIYDLTSVDDIIAFLGI